MASLWPLHSSSSLGSIRTYTQILIVYEFGRNFDFVRHNYDLSLQRPTVVSWCCSILSFPEMSSLLKKSLNWSVSSKPGPEKNWAPIKFEATWRWGSRKLRSSRFNFILMAATVFFSKTVWPWWEIFLMNRPTLVASAFLSLGRNSSPEATVAKTAKLSVRFLPEGLIRNYNWGLWEGPLKLFNKDGSTPDSFSFIFVFSFS